MEDVLNNQRVEYASPMNVDEHFDYDLSLATKWVLLDALTIEHYSVVVIEGSASLQVDFQSHQAQECALICLSPGQIFKITDAAEDAVVKRMRFNQEFYCIETHGKEVACNGKLFNNSYRSSFSELSIERRNMVLILMKQIENELQNPGVAHKDALIAYIRMVLVEALRVLHENNTATEDTFDQKVQGLSAQFIALVDQHYKVKHAVQEYADLLFTTPRSLAKRLKQDGYDTPLQLIKGRLLLEAKRQLRYTDRSVKEIAFYLGYEDPGYFTRFFKKNTGSSPAQYRETALS